MRRSCATSVARAMGYLSRPSQEDTQFIDVPKEGVIRSYHAGGMSNKDAFKNREARQDSGSMTRGYC